MIEVDNLGTIITVFLAVIIGVVLVIAVADTESTLRTVGEVTDETVVAAQNATQYSLSNDDLVSGSEVVTCVSR